MQIGFLTEWQLYAQKLEGDSWTGDKLDKAKLDKMSGVFCLRAGLGTIEANGVFRSATRATL